MDKNVGASRQSRVLLGQGALLLQLQHDRESRKHQLPVQKFPGVASWPCHIDHLVHTNTPFPRSLKRQENAQKVPTLHYSFHIESQVPLNASSLKCMCLSVVTLFQNLGRSLSNLATKPGTSTATFSRGRVLMRPPGSDLLPENSETLLEKPVPPQQSVRDYP